MYIQEGYVVVAVYHSIEHVSNLFFPRFDTIPYGVWSSQQTQNNKNSIWSKNVEIHNGGSNSMCNIRYIYFFLFYLLKKSGFDDRYTKSEYIAFCLHFQMAASTNNTE